MARASRDDELLRLLGARLRAARARRGWSQQQLADGAGVELRSVSRFETGTRALSIFMLYRLANVLGVPPAELLDVERAAPDATADPGESAWLAAWREMDAEDRELALRVVAEIARRR